jgi:hypothetical protein
MKHYVVLIALLFAAISVRAQQDPEYRLELGGGLGLAAYEGDFNENPLKGMQPMATLVAKYKLNPRMAWGCFLGYTQLKGSSEDAGTYYPDLDIEPIKFKSKVVDFQLRFECNFWAFGTGREYFGAKPWAPFMTFGLGLTFANVGKSAAGLQLPIGLGVKYKLAKRLNLAAEWVMHFTGTDEIDGISDPFNIKSSGLFKNTDCYSVLGVTLTYDLWEKCKTCNNDKD